MQTSINIQPCKVTASERHNKREKQLSYTRPELSHLNEWYNTLDVHLKSYDARLRKLIKAKTGRACQAKSHPLHEAVVVIRPDTTIEDIKKLAEKMADRWGFHFVQMAIHKDEGHWKNGIWKPNLHAHMVFDKIDHETGKTIKTTKADTAEMQDMCADVLHMERGKKGSTAQHLDAISFKIAAEEKRAEAQTKAIALQSVLGGLAIHAAKQECATAMKAYGHLQRAQDELTAENEKTAKEVEKLRSESVRLSEEGKSLEETKENLTSDILKLQAQKEEIGSEAESLADVVQAARSDLSHLNAQKIAVSGAILNLNQERDKAAAEAEQAKARKRAAEAEAAKHLAAGAVNKIGNVLGFGKEAKQLKELPKQLEAARSEGRAEAMREVLKGANMEYKDMSKITPEKIGRDLVNIGKSTAENATKQLRNLKAENEALTSRNKLLLSIPIIEKALEVLRSFVYHIFATFSIEDKKVLSQVLQGDESRAKTLRDIGEAYGGTLSQGQYWSRWNEAEREMVKIARGEDQEQDQGRNQSRGCHL